MGWRRTFGYALKYIIYAFVWLVIGGIVISMGYMMIAGSVLGDYWKLIWGMILVIIGIVVVIFGLMAAYFKVMSS
jgi:hypothetical protein